MFVLARFGAGHLVLHHRSRQIDGALEADWGSAAEEAARMLELSDDVTLLQSQDTFAPAIWGFRNPTLFLPAKVKWSFERKLVILLHEFAHIKRKDSQALWLQQFVAALYWFNPIVLVSLAEARKACEQACDDMVLGSGVRPSDYASHLLEISESMLPGKSSGAVFCFLGTRTLENRLTAILDPLVSRSAPNIFAKTLGWIAIASSLLVLAASCPFALAQQSADIPSSASNPGAPQAENPILPAPVSVNKPRQDSPLTASSSPNPPLVEVAPESLAGTDLPPPHTSQGPSKGGIVSTPADTAQVAAPKVSIQPLNSASTEMPSPPETKVTPVTGLAVDEQSKEKGPASMLSPEPPTPASTSVRLDNAPGDAVLKEGTRIWLSFTRNLSSKTAVQGESVPLVLINDIKVGNVTVATAGTIVSGELIYARKAMAPGRSGILKIRLDALQVGGAKINLRSSKGKPHENIVQYGHSFHLKFPFGLVRPGDDIEISPDTALSVYVDNDVLLPVAR